MKFVAAIAIILAISGLALLLKPRAARAGMLAPGDLAPDFSTDAVLGDQTVPAHLTDYRGRQVVLYFYPKDNTPGCTKEACAFRDGYAKLQQWGVAVLGCSIDGADAHRAFVRKYRLPFPLLLDPDKKIAKAYGADNGIPILGLDRRITYVIGPDGRILKVYPQVDPGTHATEIIHDLAASQTRPSPAAGAPAAVLPSTGPAVPPADSDME
jgi:peroxiredoxin Q/BCP